MPNRKVLNKCELIQVKDKFRNAYANSSLFYMPPENAPLLFLFSHVKCVFSHMRYFIELYVLNMDFS